MYLNFVTENSYIVMYMKVARFARNVKCDFLGGFSNTVRPPTVLLDVLFYASRDIIE